MYSGRIIELVFTAHRGYCFKKAKMQNSPWFETNEATNFKIFWHKLGSPRQGLFQRAGCYITLPFRQYSASNEL
jgi:hypothetical protein